MTRRKITLGIAIIPVVFLVVALAITLIVYKQPPHIPLLISSAVAALLAFAFRLPWSQIHEGMVKGINLALPAVLILMIVGIMIGTWILGGIVPSMIYYGLKILTPGIFLFATFIICSIVSLGTGSSWSTAGTIGVALIGIGKGMGFSMAMVAGAIISGSYFGDKMSPLSDTTNLAPAVSGTNIFSHIRHMIYTTAPAYVISCFLYIFLGIQFSGGTLNAKKIDMILSTMKSDFFIHPILLIPPIFVILMVVRKKPPLPSLFAGTIMGGIFAMICQSKSLEQVIQTAQSGYISLTGVDYVDNLLTRGGLEGMQQTLALIICALCYGGIMEKTGMLEILAKSLLKRIKTTGSLVLMTIMSCIGMNIIAAEQLTAIVIPGRMYKNAFDARGLHPKNLSRCLEDSATLFNPLVPWSTCGAFLHATLGVSAFQYLPYAFLNLLNPVISVFYGYTGITMEKINQTEKS